MTADWGEVINMSVIENKPKNIKKMFNSITTCILLRLFWLLASQWPCYHHVLTRTKWLCVFVKWSLAQSRNESWCILLQNFNLLCIGLRFRKDICGFLVITPSTPRTPGTMVQFLMDSFKGGSASRLGQGC